jgi:uncharacterized LabA/DUF88 family protein
LDTHVYIDGFNLYYGLLRSSPFKWLNLEAFCDQLLPKNNVKKIAYFTARVTARPRDPDQPIRQQMYLRALATLPRVEVYFGTFLNSVIRQPLVAPHPTDPRKYATANGKPVLKMDGTGVTVTDWVLKTEEKGSDVNLAAHLLRDAYRQNCKCVVIVSNDSDLLTPIRMAKSDCGLKVGLILPRPKGSIELKSVADFTINPRQHYLGTSQFPQTLADSTGTITRPAAW